MGRSSLDVRDGGGPSALRRLLRIARDHEGNAAARKLVLLETLERATLPDAARVSRLHEVLCYLTAYPDDPAVLHMVRRLLDAFARRADLRAWRGELVNTGIAGTEIHCDFNWFTADWIARNWPAQLRVDWDGFESQDALDAIMYPILEEHERLAYEGTTRTLKEIVDVLRAPGETDAVYLVRCFRRLRIDPMVLEHVYEDISLSMRLMPGTDTPSRTRAFFAIDDIEYEAQPTTRPVGTARERIETDPREVHDLSRRDGRRIVDLGREAMITRDRDLFAFMHADERDAWLVDFGAGLTFSCVGLVPERRHLLYGQYILMALRNGIPVAYVQACVLFDSAEMNFNVFDTFRGAEASRVFVSSLALVRHLFGVEAFTINTQQLGQGNRDALASGAWWFYYKHGFRPWNADAWPVVQRELAAKRRDPAHRSNLRTLEELSTREMYCHLGEPRGDVVGRVDTSRIGAAIARHGGEHFREGGVGATRARETAAARLLDPPDPQSWSRDERRAWQRWAPLALALPGVETWTRSERRELAGVIRAKGGRSEADYIEAFRHHGKLAAAVLELARS